MDNGAGSYRRFLDGDESTFDAIMEELFPALVFFLNRYVQDLHAAEDLAVDAFADLLVHRHRYNFKVTLKTYLFMLGKSRALDYLKRRKMIVFTDLSEAAEMTEEKLLEERVLDNERNRRINAALNQLPQDMRAAVHLIYFEQMSYAQAATVMKKTKKQVDNLLFRAKKELRAILGEDGESWL